MGSAVAVDLSRSAAFVRQRIDPSAVAGDRPVLPVVAVWRTRRAASAIAVEAWHDGFVADDDRSARALEVSLRSRRGCRRFVDEVFRRGRCA